MRMAAARTQILSGLDIGLYSLFGQYDRELLKEYDLFFLNGSGSSGTLNLAAVYDNLESYMKPVLKQNSQKLSIVQGGLSGYRLATDENGEVFYRQAVSYMKDTLGSQGVQKLIQKFQEKKDRVEDAEKAGAQAEENKSLESYDSEMNAAAQNSQEAAQQQTESGNSESGDTDISSGEDLSDGKPEEKIENPIPVLKAIRKMSLLDLVVPAEKGISENCVSKSELLSGRDPEKGMEMTQPVKTDSSYASSLLFQQYLMDKLGCYTCLLYTSPSPRDRG